MAQQISEIKASARPRSGKGGARAARREGRVPGVIYGNGAAENVTLDHRELTLLWGRGKFLSTIIDLDIDGNKQKVIPREIQLDPVKDLPLHVDFLRLSKDDKIQVAVPVVFVNEEESPGLKKGGVLNVVRHELELVCESDKIPDDIQIDVTGLEVGDSVHISQVKLPAGSASAITDRDFTIATVVAPSGMRSEAAEGEVEAGAEGEAEG